MCARFDQGTLSALNSGGWSATATVAHHSRYGCKATVRPDGSWQLRTPARLLAGSESHPALAAMECNNLSWEWRTPADLEADWRACETRTAREHAA